MKMSENTAIFIPRRTRGWRMGLANMLAKELASWFRTRRWWVQCLLWLVILNGSLALTMQDSYATNAGMNYLVMAGIALPIAAVSLAQDAILSERHSGTAAWVLSKPLRRVAFLLSKLFACALGCLLTGVVIPGALAFFQLTPRGLNGLSPLGYAGALGLMFLNVLFYLTLALMLATFFNSRGPVLGISLGLTLTPILVLINPKLIPDWIVAVLPWKFLMPLGNGNSLAGCLAIGQPLPSLLPVIGTVLWCLVFTAVAIWRFRREEF
jgi:ABC-type transport system involved in multi-copper enzyme maturation permease subunit